MAKLILSSLLAANSDKENRVRGSDKMRRIVRQRAASDRVMRGAHAVRDVFPKRPIIFYSGAAEIGRLGKAFLPGRGKEFLETRIVVYRIPLPAFPEIVVSDAAIRVVDRKR